MHVPPITSALYRTTPCRCHVALSSLIIEFQSAISLQEDILTRLVFDLQAVA